VDFQIWAVRSLHLFAVVAWIGGLLFQSVVTHPVLTAENSEFASTARNLVRRFLPILWMCVWTAVVTGAGLMLFDPRFVWFDYGSRWSVLLGLKQLVFLLMVFFTIGYVRMFRRAEESMSTGAPRQNQNEPRLYHERMVQFNRINVGLSIAALLLASAMHS
jgi:uncharacterized membrane protein